MKHWILALPFVVAVFSGLPTAAKELKRTDEILLRFKDANHWRNHVMVVAHRTGWKENGQYRYPDNSLSGIRHSIRLGVELVEMDIRKTADGVPVLMHDEYLDRTTTCTGPVAQYRYEALLACRLVVDGSRTVTDERIPRLVDAFATTRDQVLVNIDNKLDMDMLPEIAAAARSMHMPEQILIKQNVWNSERIEKTGAVLEKVGRDIAFMPILADDAVHSATFMSDATSAFGAGAAELVHWHPDGAPLTPDGGSLFSTKARAAAVKGNWHLWVNIYPIINKPDGMLAGGRGDGLAAINPDAVYGFWIDHGATIIQTDEPRATLAWLQTYGYRMPYAHDLPDVVAAIGTGAR